MRLCLSISDYHPKSWNPAWSVSTILTGLLSFMVGDETTAGSVQGTDEARKQFAAQSKEYNIKSNSMFVAQYPELVDENKKELAKAKTAAAAAAAAPSRRLEKVTLAKPSGESDNNADNAADVPVPNDEGVQQPRFSRGQKLVCVAVLFVSWLVASKLFSSRF